MRELKEEEMKETLEGVNKIIAKMVNGEIRDVMGISKAIEETIKDGDRKEWLLSVLVAERVFKSMGEYQKMKETERSGQVMFA